MTRLLTLALVVVLAFGISALSIAAEGAGQSCVMVEGTIHGVSIARFDGEALVGFDVTVTEVSGLLSGGEIAASLTITQFLEDGSLMFDGTHRVSGTQVGTFSTSDHGFTSVAGRVADILTINDGASGFLVTMGHVDLETGKLVLQYTGIVCEL